MFVYLYTPFFLSRILKSYKIHLQKYLCLFQSLNPLFLLGCEIQLKFIGNCTLLVWVLDLPASYIFIIKKCHSYFFIIKKKLRLMNMIFCFTSFEFLLNPPSVNLYTITLVKRVIYNYCTRSYSTSLQKCTTKSVRKIYIYIRHK